MPALLYIIEIEIKRALFYCALGKAHKTLRKG